MAYTGLKRDENAFVCRCVFVSRTSKSHLKYQHFNAGKVTEKK